MKTRAHCASAVVMIPPDDFGFNEETARDNEFQHRPEQGVDFRHLVMAEFTAAVAQLEGAGIDVIVIEKNPALPALPDAVFPNNWFSTWPDGRVVLYPMRTTNRQAELRPADLQRALQCRGYHLEQFDVLAHAPGQALEGTGALIFDHLNRWVYAARSERCDSLLVEQHAHALGYQPYLFDTCSSHGRPFYHTNVMMSIGEDFALLCTESVLPEQREALLAQLQRQKRDIVEVSLAQAEQAFCANILQLKNTRGERLVVMSASALNAFSAEQKLVLSRHGQMLALPVNTIEHMGGGSARCMLAEVFLAQN